MGSAARTIARCGLIIAVVAVTDAGMAAVQQDQQAGPATVNVEVDPIRCWWRTSAGAIRVGEPFSIMLTCAVVENALNTVVPDQSQIEPAALQLPPFEVTGGRGFVDRRSPDHRFFQYEYQVRLIQEDVFGADVALPPLEIRYRIRTRMSDGSEVDGLEGVYVLPPASVRVLSLVPDDASDIREAAGGTFGEPDDLASQASVLRLVAIVLFSLGAVVAIQLLVGVTRRFARRDETPRELIPAALVLRGASRELGAVQRQRVDEEWSADLVGRALAALRIVGAHALERRTGQAALPVKARGYPEEDQGYLVMPGGWLRDAPVLVCGSVTGATVATALEAVGPGNQHRPGLEDLQAALARFTEALYGRQGDSLDESALDESVERSIALAQRLAVQQLWPVKRFHALTARAAAVGRRVWAR